MTSELLPGKDPPSYQSRTCLDWATCLLCIMLLRYTPQVDAWGQLQASHLLEGPICLRRNFNHRFLTLESEWDNRCGTDARGR